MLTIPRWRSYLWKLLLPMSWAHRHNSSLGLCIPLTFAAKHIWQPITALPPLPSFRSFSITEALLSTSHWEHLPISNSDAPTRWQATPPKRKVHTKISSPSGKTPTPTPQSTSKPKRSMRSCNSEENFLSSSLTDYPSLQIAFYFGYECLQLGLIRCPDGDRKDDASLPVGTAYQ